MSYTIVLDVHTVGFLVGTVLPLLVGLVTTRVTSPAVQALLLAFLSAVNGFLSEFLDKGDTFDPRAALLTWIGSFLVAVGFHYGLWKPIQLSRRVQDLPGLTIRRKKYVLDEEAILQSDAYGRHARRNRAS